MSKLAATLAKKMPVRFVVMSGSGTGVIAVGGKRKIRYILKAARYLRAHVKAGDIVLGYGHGGALAGYFGTRGTNARFWYDYPDPWSGWYHHNMPTDSLKWQIGREAFSKIERRLYKDADLLTTASFEQLAFLEKQHGKRTPNNKMAKVGNVSKGKTSTSVILNCPDTRIFRRIRPVSMASMGLPKNARVLLYLGSILEEYGCRTLIEMMPSVLKKNPDSYLVFLGSAKNPEFLDQLKVAAQQLDANGNAGGNASKHVVFLSPVPSARVPAYLSAAEIGYVPFKDVLYNNVGSPNKLFEYMACGPVPIVSEMAEFHHYIENGKNGVLVEPENPDAFASATNKLLSNGPLLEKMLRANLALAQKQYNWQFQQRKLETRLSQLVKSSEDDPCSQ
ncbi:glycosyltransferase family 4 protein [Candidatus Micrarchaeota archaeon]|nr:glycosyltransferase family 4 protein [Candidatus Micrarchaeota archaeon]